MRVLVADDDATCRHVATAVVGKLGHDCLTAEDGQRAWTMLQDEAIDVLITDWMMPGLDGPGLCRRVRGGDAHRYTYIVMLTSLSKRDHVLAGMEAGADDFLTKPLDPFDVQTRLIAAERVTALHRQIEEFGSELERLNGTLAEQARTDPLTGLGNRLRLHEDLTEVHGRSGRSGRPYSIAICDIDHFKRFNDSAGHIAGDEALKRVAEIIGLNCRVTDRAYRYGGEEFVVLYDDGLPGVGIAADRLRHAVERDGIEHPDSTHRVVTISVGIASWDRIADPEVDAVLAQADLALYQAKDQGRNRVVAAADLSSAPVEQVLDPTPVEAAAPPSA